MTYKVLFNLNTSLLSISTSNEVDIDVIELFSSNSVNENSYLCLNFCKVFCLGYLQGNNKNVAKNLPSEFE